MLVVICYEITHICASRWPTTSICIGTRLYILNIHTLATPRILLEGHGGLRLIPADIQREEGNTLDRLLVRSQLQHWHRKKYFFVVREEACAPVWNACRSNMLTPTPQRPRTFLVLGVNHCITILFNVNMIEKYICAKWYNSGFKIGDRNHI